MAQIIVGCLEPVTLKEFGVVDELAKIDTGAYSGALHCTNIRIVRRGWNRKRYLQFIPLGNKKLAQETDTFKRIKVRSATGHQVKRYLVITSIEILGKVYPIQIGLSDRSDMKRSVLVGRRFLRDNGILVDVNINQELDDEGEQSR